MSKTLVIPDIHEDIMALESIIKQAGSVDHTVFLGDWFDTYKFRETSIIVKYLEDNIKDSKKTFLWGNHDLPYAYPKIRGLRCSGFDVFKLANFISKITPFMREYFKFTVNVEGWQLSHAGFNKNNVSEYLFLRNDVHIDPLEYCREQLNSDIMPNLLRCGYSRGGDVPLGGCTWLDWKDEFAPVEGLKQIVGHTKGKFVRWHGNNVCIDTELRHFATIENGEVVIHESN